MKNLWQSVREFIPMAAVIVLCLVTVPCAQANTNTNGSSTTEATHQTSPQPTVAAAPDGTKTTKAKPKATKPASRSVLDDEVLDSPIAYFRDAFSAEEETPGTSPSSGAVMMTVKALVATLLSTIL